MISFRKVLIRLKIRILGVVRQFNDYKRIDVPTIESGDSEVYQSIGREIHLVSFAAGASFSKKISIFKEQAKETGWFSSVTVYTDKDLPVLLDALSLNQADILEFINTNREGYGYWVWKPIVIKHALAGIPCDDLLVYADVGCEFSKDGGDLFHALVLKACSKNGLFFRLPFFDKNWTNPALYSRFKPWVEIIFPEQISATCFLLVRSKASEDLISEWLILCIEKKFKNLIPDLFGLFSYDYIDHRHDQSLLSLVVKAKFPIDFSIIPQVDHYADCVYQSEDWKSIPIHSLRSRKRKLP